MTLSFHPCIVSYQNIPWSYKNDVKLCGCTIELRRNAIAQYQPQHRENVTCFISDAKVISGGCVIGSQGCSNSLNVQINMETARSPPNDEYFYDFDKVSYKYIQNSSTTPVLEVV